MLQKKAFTAGEPVSDFIRLLLKVMEGREKLRAWGHSGFPKVKNTQGIRAQNC